MADKNTQLDTPTSTLYFAYGSNLWLAQMATRCPSSPYKGLARLPGYKWIINTRGYANVVEVPTSTSTSTSTSTTTPFTTSEIAETTTVATKDEVWGLVYALPPLDEAQLDINEGVPRAYTKEYLACEFWPTPPILSSYIPAIDTRTAEPRTATMLVYIDRKRVEDGTPREEYVYRMNRGIEDALERGVPRGYVEGVLRSWIRDDGGGDGDGDAEDGGVRELARAQAGRFRDESGVF